MAALGWYQTSGSGGWPTDAPPSSWSGSSEPYFPYPVFIGGVIGAADGPVKWKVLWNGADVLPSYLDSVVTDDLSVRLSFRMLPGPPEWVWPTPSGIITIAAADDDGAMTGVLRLTMASGDVYGAFAWDVVAPEPPEQPGFWTEFVSAYEVP